MKYIPILFSTPMVQAILNGTKTQTRREIKPQPESELHDHTKYPMSIDSKLQGFWGTVAETGETKQYKCPYGQPGDVLWVRESWGNEYGGGYLYKAEHAHMKPDPCWKPSIHMPKAACRLFLEVVSVRVERLKDISDSDAIAEGIEKVGNEYKNYWPSADRIPSGPAKWSFCTLWISINGADSYSSNPFVWVIEFKRVDKPANFN